MFPFDVILFDVAGVLLTNGWGPQRARRGPFQTFTLTCGVRGSSPGALSRAWESGAISAEAYLNATGLFTSRAVFYCCRVLLPPLRSIQTVLPDGALGKSFRNFAASINVCWAL